MLYHGGLLFRREAHVPATRPRCQGTLTLMVTREVVASECDGASPAALAVMCGEARASSGDAERYSRFQGVAACPMRSGWEMGMKTSAQREEGSTNS